MNLLAQQTSHQQRHPLAWASAHKSCCTRLKAGPSAGGVLSADDCERRIFCETDSCLQDGEEYRQQRNPATPPIPVEGGEAQENILHGECKQCASKAQSW